MNRRIVHFFVALSLMLCVATAVLWVRSHFRYDQLIRLSGHSQLEVTSLRGTLVCGRYYYDDGNAAKRWKFFTGTTEGTIGGIDVQEEIDSYRITPVGSAFPTGQPPYQRSAESFGAGFVINHGRYGIDYRSIFVPDWFLLMLFAVLPAWWLFRKYLGRRRHGTCQTCGYDLRATPERCPECGTARVAE